MGYRIVKMTEELFAGILTEGNVIPNRPDERLVVRKGLPEGAKLEAVSHGLYFDMGVIALKFSHPSWPDVPPGQPIPELSIEWWVERTEPFVVEGG